MGTDLIVAGCHKCHGTGLGFFGCCVYCLTGQRLAAWYDWWATPNDYRISIQRIEVIPHGSDTDSNAA